MFDLGIPLDGDGPQPGGSRINPVRLMSATGADQPFPGAFRYADDYVFMPLQAASQWDSLAHVFYDEQMYNGYPSSDVGPYGAAHNSIDKMAKGIAGRGVLLDIARLKGVDWLEKGQVITPGDLEEAEAAQGVVLIREMGMTLGEILDFAELADDCAADGVWEFFLCAPPLKFTKGVGSPINPLALK